MNIILVALAANHKAYACLGVLPAGNNKKQRLLSLSLTIKMKPINGAILNLKIVTRRLSLLYSRLYRNRIFWNKYVPLRVSNPPKLTIETIAQQFSYALRKAFVKVVKLEKRNGMRNFYFGR